MIYRPEATGVNRELSKIAATFDAHVDALAAMSKRIEALEARPVPVPVPDADVLWRWDATSVMPFGIHARSPSRVTLVQAGGRNAVRLLTMPGDTNVNGSGDWERCDLRLSNELSDAKEGRQWWFKHGIWFPDDYEDLPQSPLNPPPWYAGVALNWHEDSDTPGTQQPFQLMVMPPTGTDSGRPTGLHAQIYGGVGGVKQGDFPIAPIVRNMWYDLVYHIRWTATSAGFANGWLNGRQFMKYVGPTLHAGRGAYLKLANYHTAHGKLSAVLHGPIVRARTEAALG